MTAAFTHSSVAQAITPLGESYKNRFNSLGIPVDNLTRGEAVSQIFRLIEQFKTDGIPKLVATLNVDFLVNSLGYRFDRPRHPELMNVLRGADLITADGFPIVLLSKISGFPLKERVTGADLTPALARRAAETGSSIYLFGGEGDSAERAAEKLQAEIPGLEIAGTSSPFVYTEGENLADWETQDFASVEAINASGADILFIALGNPKQELWFSRNKHRLTVAVSIGIGGTFSFITGQVKRAPLWMQNSNLEWIYRISQDPKRLAKRYAIGLLKLAVLTAPLLLQRCKTRLLEMGESNKQTPDMQQLNWRTHWASREDALRALRLPRLITRPYLEILLDQLHVDELQGSDNYTYLLDFSKVASISLSANEAFCELCRKFESRQLHGLLVGMSHKLRQKLKQARIMDLANTNSIKLQNMQSSIIQSTHRQSQVKTYVAESSVLCYFAGNINGNELEAIGFETCLADATRDRDAVIDMRQVRSIDSAALALLQRLSRIQRTGKIRSLRISGMNPALYQMLKVTDLQNCFEQVKDQDFYDLVFSSATPNSQTK